MDYQKFNNIFNHIIFCKSNPKADLLINIAKHSERYLGIFRPTKTKTKLLQSLLVSREIKFGKAFECLVGKYLKEYKFDTSPDKYEVLLQKALEIDQLAKKDNTYYFIEQKMRDDHDSAKKRGQIENFKEKLKLLINRYGENIKGYFYFIDDCLAKNKKYYEEELQKLSFKYKVPLKLCYGRELFEFLNIPQVWSEILEYLVQWRETLPDLPSLNFDKYFSESFEEIKDLPPNIYRKLLDNDEIFENIVLMLFPKRKVLEMLVEHFRQQDETIYRQLASKLANKLSYHSK
ncbi:HpyAIV family type II restriction enzyme [Helicobacter cetorum]|uniref:type II site-specific deoxyribonuclease n=1 Tax=Helicobacter cetorum (strain ATCC BAA-540 / CCUG 52418 / MIT 99-5656) TaxID=1163745 RepID=I0ESE2_HELCM|nr:hypothetical protein [Helicobacter cetorum]AFI05861.1 hypothetical protein HCD_04235 [Helicobacter cetorum MIT 99-5656]